MTAIHYRQATRDEFNLAVEWASKEGWNPGLRDADIFWATDPTGYVCAECDGEVVGTGSIVRYGEDFGFMGFFIVRPDLRGQGIGRDFWYWRRDTLKGRLSDNAPIGMDGVFDMQPFYAKGGFEFTHRNLRMEGVGQAHERDESLVELNTLGFEQVAAYDRKHFGFPRDEFLRAWIQPHGGLALGALEGKSITGMGVIRPCQRGYKIGPLFADDADTAERIFRSLSSHATSQPLFLDIPENNPAALDLAKRHDLKEVFGCARMYHGATPELPWQQIFGITTFELG